VLECKLEIINLRFIKDDLLYPINSYPLNNFWNIPTERREDILTEAIIETHAWHFDRNLAYRRTVSARGIGPNVNRQDFPILIRPTAQIFKSYIDLIGSAFPQNNPVDFLKWLADNISIEIPRERFGQFRRHYSSLEALLKAIESIYADFGFEISTSSGTSGRSSIIIRNQESIDRTVESFYLAFQRIMGMRADHRAIFIMPIETRIAMVRMASFSITRVGVTKDRFHYTIPFPAYPDHVRIRAGKTLQPGWHGQMEKRIMHPAMNWLNDHYVFPQAIQKTRQLLEQAELVQERILLFGSWSHLHAVALQLKEHNRVLSLAPGSILGCGGGMKEQYPFTPSQIRQDLSRYIQLIDNKPIPIHDVYGMGEGNWAAMQCKQGNYHIPPWVYATVLDNDDNFTQQADFTGLLAFFDPFGGGRLFPSFYKTADQVRLVNGAGCYNPSLDCSCGETGAYIVHDSIQRVDLLGEAGCGATV
jgi:hypothetical protein